MKKKIVEKFLMFCIIFLSSYQFNAQSFLNGAYLDESRVGIKVGLNTYDANTNFASTKSGTGYHLGIVFDSFLGENVGILSSIEYQLNKVEFKTIYTTKLQGDTSPFEKKYREYFMMNINIPLKVYYMYLNIDDTWMFKVNTGGSFNFFYGFGTGESDSGVKILPYNLPESSLNPEGTINVFWNIGTSVSYKRFEFGVDYFRGVSNPYRDFEGYESQDQYFNFGLTYYFEDRF